MYVRICMCTYRLLQAFQCGDLHLQLPDLKANMNSYTIILLVAAYMTRRTYLQWSRSYKLYCSVSYKHFVWLATNIFVWPGKNCQEDHSYAILAAQQTMGP